VWPIAIRYTDGGRPTDAAAFIGEMGLFTSLGKILAARDLEIRITVLHEIGHHFGMDEDRLDELGYA
jgi:hypothetical protein